MLENTIQDQVFSKVILCGEHSVLRGGMAVVAPLSSHSLDYSFKASQKGLEISYSEKTAPYEILIEGTFEKALQLLDKNRGDVSANVNLRTLVPLGKGLGGSAALCVFISRLMKFLGFIDGSRIFSFSVELENMFHGESSGVDIAGCLSSGPQSYVRGEQPKKIQTNMDKIVFGLVETGEIGETEDCIEKVLRLKHKNKDLFYSLDSDMDKASRGIAESLESGEIDVLKSSFDLARKTFESWDLVTPKMQTVMTELLEAGAVSCKPTGSGMGGYILSVWDKKNEEKAKAVCAETFSL